MDTLGADLTEFEFAGELLKLDDVAKKHGLNREEVRG
jgi:hypothetical protein